MTAGSNNRQNMQRAYRRLLKSLTVTGVVLEATGTGDVAPEWVLRGAKSRSPVSSALVRHALSTGALERQDPGGTARRLGISDDGRKALRRLLCTGDAAQSQHRELAETVLKDDPASPVEHLTVNLRESPIAWLASRRDSKGRPLLDIALVKAGERLRADYTFAALVPSLAKGWQTERTSSGGASTCGRELTDDVLSARERGCHGSWPVGADACRCRGRCMLPSQRAQNRGGRTGLAGPIGKSRPSDRLVQPGG